MSTRVDLSFAVNKLAKFSENLGKVHFEGSVHILRYIIYNNILVLKYYEGMNDAPISDMLIQASVKTKNHLMDFFSSCKYCPDIGRSIGGYNIFYQGGPIEHGTHVPGPVSQSSAEGE